MQEEVPVQVQANSLQWLSLDFIRDHQKSHPLWGLSPLQLEGKDIFRSEWNIENEDEFVNVNSRCDGGIVDFVVESCDDVFLFHCSVLYWIDIRQEHNGGLPLYGRVNLRELHVGKTRFSCSRSKIYKTDSVHSGGIRLLLILLPEVIFTKEELMSLVEGGRAIWADPDEDVCEQIAQLIAELHGCGFIHYLVHFRVILKPAKIRTSCLECWVNNSTSGSQVFVACSAISMMQYLQKKNNNM